MGDLCRYEKYYGFIGSGLLDMFLMKVITSKDQELKWLYDDTNDSGHFKFSVAWKFDIDLKRLTHEENFINKLLKSSNNLVAANISLFKNGRQSGHRNLFFLDKKSGVFYLHEPNLVHESDDCNYISRDVDDNAKTTRNIFNETLLYFKDMLQKSFRDSNLTTTRLFNLGPWIYYHIQQTNNTKLIENGTCTLNCYIFLLWILHTKDRLCRGNLANLLELELNVENTILDLFASVDEITSPNSLVDKYDNIRSAVAQIRNL